MAAAEHQALSPSTQELLLETPTGYPANLAAPQGMRLGVGAVNAGPVAEHVLHLQGASDSAERSPSESWSTGSDEALGALSGLVPISTRPSLPRSPPPPSALLEFD